ncbi:MAG: ATP-binding protein [Candidatus Marsarchaeota archaeon]|nr:ATP-binding protein [Candidatus Marsarchaeota archaeon]MCL5413079.1 ATP-binding protein [Candidatus Marsarchaeota archaeon]
MEFSDIFEEWDAYAQKKQLKGRHFEFSSAVENADKKIVAITGVRRCGKSSLLMLIRQRLAAEGKKALYVNVEDSRISHQEDILDEILKWFGDNGFLLLDEITAVKGWEGWLARVHEQLKGKIKIIITSSRKSLITPSKLLRGRLLPMEFYTLSFIEYLSFKNIRIEKTTLGRGRLERAFDEYLKYGGFPEVALANNGVDKVSYINSYFKDIMGLDIAEVTGEDLGAVETFARYALQSSYFSASKCLNFMKTLGYKIGKEKILRLEGYSQASYLFYFVPIFSYNIKDRLQYPRKSFAGDTGFFYGITGRKDLGMVFENLIFLELKRRLKPSQEICYWKDRKGLEADFIIKQGNAVVGIIQAAYRISDEKTKKREVDAAISAAKEFKIKKVSIVTMGAKPEEKIGGVKIVYPSVIDWLLG